MSDPINAAVHRVIETMYKRLGDDISIDEMARVAMYSKFHFSRTFRDVTGVSPGRFLAALRFQEAKRLLTHSRLSVAEISNRVGYSSLGTFSSRFKRCVGMTPTEYRRSGGRWTAPRPVAVGSDGSAGTVQGNVRPSEPGQHGQTFIGIYAEPVPADRPVRAVVISEPGPYEVKSVPEGRWYVFAQAVAEAPTEQSPTGRSAGAPLPEPSPVARTSVGRLGPITVVAGCAPATVDLRLRPMEVVDFPVLSAPVSGPPVTGSGYLRHQW